MSSFLSPEEIPSEDTINRSIFRPQMYMGDYLDPLQVFLFSRDEARNKEVVCLAWSKYAETDWDLHALGIEIERRKKERSSETPHRYVGFISAQAGRIRKINHQNSGFGVEHDPTEGPHHVLVSFVFPQDLSLTKNELRKLKASLKEALLGVFSGLTIY